MARNGFLGTENPKKNIMWEEKAIITDLSFVATSFRQFLVSVAIGLGT